MAVGSDSEVFKSREARIDEGGVGGTVILRTREPLDLPAWSGSVSAEGTDSDTTRKIDWKPADRLKLTANYFRFELKGDYTSNVLKIPEWGYDSFFTGAKFDASGTVLQSATFDVPGAYANTSQTMETPQLSGQYSREESVSNTFDLGGAWAGGTRDLSFKFGKTRATGGPSMRFNMAAKPRFTTTDAAAANRWKDSPPVSTCTANPMSRSTSMPPST